MVLVHHLSKDLPIKALATKALAISGVDSSQLCFSRDKVDLVSSHSWAMECRMEALEVRIGVQWVDSSSIQVSKVVPCFCLAVIKA